MRQPLLRKGRPGPDGAHRQKPAESSGSLVRFLITLVLIAWAIRSFLVAPFSIPSGSMLPTLYIGDYLLVAKWPYGYSRYSFPFQFPPLEERIFERLPKRGDIVVFRHPAGDYDLVKRVIGLPGDTVEVRGGQVLLNGVAVERQKMAPVPVRVTANSPCKTVPPALPQLREQPDGPACAYPAWRETLPGGPSFVVLDQVGDGPADNFAATIVPDGHVFLMGDNRDDSLDSRFDAATGGIGMVPTERLIGRALVSFWSTDGSASYVNPLSWFTALRTDRIGHVYETGTR